MIQYLLRLFFGTSTPGAVTHHRYFHRYDPARNMTVLVCYGPVDAERVAGAKEILKGKAHARRYPQRKQPAFRLVEEDKG